MQSQITANTSSIRAANKSFTTYKTENSKLHQETIGKLEKDIEKSIVNEVVKRRIEKIEDLHEKLTTNLKKFKKNFEEIDFS